MDRIYVSSQFNIRLHSAPAPEWKITPHSDYTLFYLLEGAVQARFNERNSLLGPGCLLLFDPNRSASIGGKHSTGLKISISPSYLIDAAVRIRLLGSGKIVSFRIEQDCGNPRVERIMRDVADEISFEHAGKEALIGALIEQLTIYLVRNYSVIRMSDQLELSRVGIVDRRVRRAVELMESHLDRDLPLSELAAAAYLSAFHFSRLFKKVMGTSPHAYLAGLRTSRAQVLLSESDLSVTEIATRVGYTSSSHFTKAFRDATGLSPTAFRKALV
jgi:AraC-like DNA-binding protein